MKITSQIRCLHARQRGQYSRLHDNQHVPNKPKTCHDVGGQTRCFGPRKKLPSHRKETLFFHFCFVLHCFSGSSESEFDYNSYCPSSGQQWKARTRGNSKQRHKICYTCFRHTSTTAKKEDICRKLPKKE